MMPDPPGTSPLRVCLFTDSWEPSGVGTHMLTLAEELQALGHAVWFVCPASPAGEPFLHRAQLLGLETLPLYVGGGNLKTLSTLSRWLQENHIHVFHGHAGIGWEGHDGIWAAYAARVPVIIRTEHLPYLITNEWQQKIHADLLNAVDRLVCVSNEAHRSFQAAGIAPQKLAAICNGVRLRSPLQTRGEVRAELGLSLNRPVALTVGRFTEQKGHTVLLDAAPEIIARVPDVCFVWAGTGPLEEELRERIAKEDLTERFLLLGHRTDVPELLGMADLFVLPSLFEGLPLIVLEAMAAGLPVVGTACCGTAEAVVPNKTGLLVSPGDAPALVCAVTHALTNDENRAAWGRAGQSRYEACFSAERMGQETARLYTEVLREKE